MANVNLGLLEIPLSLIYETLDILKDPNDDDGALLYDFADALGTSVRTGLNQATLALVHEFIDANAVAGPGQYGGTDISAQTSAGPRTLSVRWNAASDEGGHYVVYGLQLIGAYQPALLDWSHTRGGAWDPIRLDATNQAIIDRARQLYGTVYAPLADAPFVVAVSAI